MDNSKTLWGVVPFFLTLILICISVNRQAHYESQSPKTYRPNFSTVPPPPPKIPEPVIIRSQDDDTAGVQVPIARTDRVYNRTGIQCVWCTIETLGRHNHVSKLDGITNVYKRQTGPAEVHNVLSSYGVRFHQYNGGQLDALEEWVAVRKVGAAIDIDNGQHMVTVVDFRRGESVKIIDNSDTTLSIRTWDWNTFSSRFTGWVLVIEPNH